MSSSRQFDEEVFPLLVDEEQNPTAGSTMLLSHVRSMSDVWKSLDVGTSAYALPGRLSLEVDISDRTPYFVEREGWIAGVHMARLRVDHLGTSLSTGWVSTSAEYWDPIALSYPEDGITIPVESPESLNGIDEAIDWLVAQLRRPIQRLEWIREGKTVATLRRLADTGRGLVMSGPPALVRDPQTATSVFQVRP